MKVSGKLLADSILNALKLEIEKDNIKAFLAIILANDSPASRMYDENKIKRAGEIGLGAKLFVFTPEQKTDALKKIAELNHDPKISGVIVQHPVYLGWDFEEISNSVDSIKDVDGFKADSPYTPATAAGVWEMLSEFGRLEGFTSAVDFLKDKKITILGRGKTAGKPIRELLEKNGFKVSVINSKTLNPDQTIKDSDVLIAATGRKHLLNASNVKVGSYVIGVGVGKDETGTYGDVKEAEIAEIAKLYCPTIGGIGPLTIACLLRNVIKSAKRDEN